MNHLAETGHKWWKKLIALGSCSVALLGTAALLGCSDEPGRIRADRAKVVGVYEISFPNGKENLELKSDGKYAQDVLSKTRPFHHTGKWHIDNHLLDGSDVILSDANTGEGEETMPLGIGDITLNVHTRAGKVALARNEVMDFYYERVH